MSAVVGVWGKPAGQLLKSHTDSSKPVNEDQNPEHRGYTVFRTKYLLVEADNFVALYLKH